MSPPNRRSPIAPPRADPEAGAASAIMGRVNRPSDNNGAGRGSTISACIIAANEARALPRCLESVAFCDEVLVVDSGSTDATADLARAAGARVIEQPWLGFAAQRNVALDNAQGDWVLEIDADERVSSDLRTEIEAFVASPGDCRIAGLPLREIFLGHRLGPSGKYPKYRHRLVLAGAYRHDERRTVHEGFTPEGPVHPFEGDLIHLLALSWRQAVSDMWSYARLEAGQLHAPRTAKNLAIGVLLRPAAKFLYRMTVDGGWRDGWPGSVKIALDCAADSIVWVRYFAGMLGAERGESGVGEGQHYGSRTARRGPIRVVAVAGTGRSAEAQRWLERAAEAGADVALITSGRRSSTVRVRRLNRLTPLSLIRALDAEEQLRTIDCVLPFGRKARLLLRAAPRQLRGNMPFLDPQGDPAQTRWDAAAREEIVTA